ncbi:AfsR/SARP family transcriptional regulator, partial [Paeniroseomonas aquatica]|uniref:AfsR/SARP family transcriptional regulator n=1 Tax=Paeniroseomonas aquatica TaxID=373043 RepID=UPI0025B58806
MAGSIPTHPRLRTPAVPAAVPDCGPAEPPPPVPMVRLVLLGRMEAWSLASTAVLPRGRKARALLAILGLAEGRPVARATLAALLWSRTGAAQQRLSLRQALHEVQAALAAGGAPLLQPGRGSLTLPAGQVWVDALEAARAAATRPEGLERLGAGLLADLDGLDPAFDAWLAERRQALKASAAAVATGLLARAVGPEAQAAAARRLLAIDPEQETGWRALMRAMAAQGDAAAALAAYRRCQDTLAARLGAAPGPETAALAAALAEPGGASGGAA